MKIYTRKGDGGDTSLFGGKQVSKDHLRVIAYGTVDELNSFIGQSVAYLPSELEKWRERLASVQSDCFTLGAMLATPKSGTDVPSHIPELSADRVSMLERWIDELDEELAPLEVFILPGGTKAAASLHVARSVCRRAERCVITLSHSGQVNPIVITYLNRLSDFLFTIARAANAKQGASDVEWSPHTEP